MTQNPDSQAGKAITGGEWLIRKTAASDIFIPEEWNEEQRMMKKMTGQMAGMGMLGKMKAMKDAGADPESAMAGMGMPDMGAMAAGLGRGGKSTKTSSVKKKFKQRKKRK